MRVVFEYRNGRTEVVHFKCDDPYPARLRVRRVVGMKPGSVEPEYQELMFHRNRWLPSGRPVYTEEEPPAPQGAA